MAYTECNSGKGGWSAVVCVGLARTVYLHRIWPYVWWFPCYKYRMYNVYAYNGMVLANRMFVLWLGRRALAAHASCWYRCTCQLLISLHMPAVDITAHASCWYRCTCQLLISLHMPAVDIAAHASCWYRCTCQLLIYVDTIKMLFKPLAFLSGSNQTKSNQIKSNQIKSNQIKLIKSYKSNHHSQVCMAARP